MTAQCAVCGSPSPDAYVDHQCALKLAQRLAQAAGHAEDAEAVITRQTRYGGGARGGTSEPLPVDLTAATRLGAIAHTADYWTRVLVEEGYSAPMPRWRPVAGALCPPPGAGREPRDYRCAHRSCETIRERTPPSPLAALLGWLAEQTDKLRHHPAAGEAFQELHDACLQLERLVDRPPDRDLVGVCDCGKVLYAPRGQQDVRCPEPTCKLRWNVAKSREILGKALRGKLFTASECARLAAHWTDRTQPQIRALITSWTRPDRHRLEARGWIPNDDCVGDGEEPQGWATYLLGDVLDLLAATPRRQRNREGVAA